jgi:hypothetical protein
LLFFWVASSIHPSRSRKKYRKKGKKRKEGWFWVNVLDWVELGIVCQVRKKVSFGFKSWNFWTMYVSIPILLTEMLLLDILTVSDDQQDRSGRDRTVRLEMHEWNFYMKKEVKKVRVIILWWWYIFSWYDANYIALSL